MAITTSFIQLEVAGANTMQSYVAAPEGNGPFPAIIVFQEAFGVNHHIRDLADRFANEGYVTIAPELFHRTAEPGFEGSYSDFSAVAQHFQGVNEEGMENDCRAVYNWFQTQHNVKKDAIATTGYCMGGRVSFLANSILPLQAAVSYYGGRIVPDLLKRASSMHAPMLFFWGGLDKHIPQEQVSAILAEMDAAGKKYVNVVFSYADHAFFCDARPSYNEEAAKLAWPLTLAFLKEKLG